VVYRWSRQEFAGGRQDGRTTCVRGWCANGCRQYASGYWRAEPLHCPGCIRPERSRHVDRSPGSHCMASSRLHWPRTAGLHWTEDVRASWCPVGDHASYTVEQLLIAARSGGRCDNQLSSRRYVVLFSLKRRTPWEKYCVQCNNNYGLSTAVKLYRSI